MIVSLFWLQALQVVTYRSMSCDILYHQKLSCILVLVLATPWCPAEGRSWFIFSVCSLNSGGRTNVRVSTSLLFRYINPSTRENLFFLIQQYFARNKSSGEGYPCFLARLLVRIGQDLCVGRFSLHQLSTPNTN